MLPTTNERYKRPSYYEIQRTTIDFPSYYNQQQQQQQQRHYRHQHQHQLSESSMQLVDGIDEYMSTILRRSVPRNLICSNNNNKNNKSNGSPIHNTNNNRIPLEPNCTSTPLQSTSSSSGNSSASKIEFVEIEKQMDIQNDNENENEHDNYTTPENFD
jgi:curved DNA-binding protein CbpA